MCGWQVQLFVDAFVAARWAKQTAEKATSSTLEAELGLAQHDAAAQKAVDLPADMTPVAADAEEASIAIDSAHAGAQRSEPETQTARV